MGIAKGFTEPTDRVKRLKQRIIDATPTVEADRAELITEAYRAHEKEAPVMRIAHANEHILNHIPITIRPDELIVGSATLTDRGCQLFPEYSYDWVAAEFDTMATRKCDPFEIPEDTKHRLEKVFEYWPGRTNSELASSLMSDTCQKCQDLGVFTVGNYYYNGIGHVCVDYGKVLKVGFSGIIKEAAERKAALDPNDPATIKKRQFYDAVIITYNACINYAHRYAEMALDMAKTEINPQRQKELLVIAQNCQNVPEKPASNFWEACQSFWFVQLIMQIESSGHSISPGRFDQYMYPYYKNDPNITHDFAQELVDCIFIKLNDLNKTRDAVSDELFAGYAIFQNMCAGGQTPEGLDATNDISYMQLDAIAHTGLPQPSMSIRYWDGTPDEFLHRACEVVRLGHGLPAMYNDEVAIPMLENDGVSLEDARDWLPIGCVEPQPQHKTDGWHDAAFFNCCKVLDITMHNGRCRGEQLGPKTGEMTDFRRVALFNGDIFAREHRKIDRRRRRCDVKRNVMGFGQNRNGKCPDFVGHIPIAGDAVRTDHDGVNFALMHHPAGHVICDQRDRNIVLVQLVGREPCPLEQRAGFIRVNLDVLAGFLGCADDAESRAVIGGRQRARVAMGQNRAARLD